MMDINIFKKNTREVLHDCDAFESLIWNVVYDDVGDFELCLPGDSSAIDYLLMDNYLEIPDSDRSMIVEKREPITDADDGPSIAYSGRSLESILDYRIIWVQTVISGNLQNGIRRLLMDNAISPTLADRRIEHLVFLPSIDPAITNIEIEETMFTGESLLDTVVTLCRVNKIGWKITIMVPKTVRNLPLEGKLNVIYTYDNKRYIWNDVTNQYRDITSDITITQDTKFLLVFQLYSGKNRTTQQTALPQVVFSLYNDNLFSSKRTVDKKPYKNVTLIAGEGEGTARRTQIYGSASGLDRRELYTDARDISSNQGQEDAISDTDYNKLLIERGKAKLAEQIIEQEVEGEVDTSGYSMFQYQKDYFIGDIVENVDEYGQRYTSRINEMTIHLDNKGYASYPIFEQEDILD